MWNTFSPRIQVDTYAQKHTRVKLWGNARCRSNSNYWGGYSQIIGGIYPPIPPGFGTPEHRYLHALVELVTAGNRTFALSCLSLIFYLSIMKKLFFSAIRCVEQVAPTNGGMLCTDSNNLDSVCQFSCNFGFVFVGNEATTCLDDENNDVIGQWTSPPPECQRKFWFVWCETVAMFWSISGHRSFCTFLLFFNKLILPKRMKQRD